MKLKSKIIFIFILFGISVFLPISFIFKHNSDTNIVNQEKQNLEDLSKSISTFLSNSIYDKINLSYTLTSAPIVKELLLKSNHEFSKVNKQTRHSKIKKLNKIWINTKDNNSAFIQKYLSNDLSRYLKEQENIINNLYGEIFVTNKFGTLVASTGKLTTLAHRHKYWWKESFNNGKGKIFIDDRGFDTSVGGYVLGIVLPIFNNNEIIGIIKVNLNIKETFSKLVDKLSSNHHTSLSIIRSKGLIVYKEGVLPLSKKVDEEIISNINNKDSGSFLSNNEITSFSNIDFSYNNMDLKFGGKNKSIDHLNGNNQESWHVLIRTNIDKLIENSLSEHYEHFFTVLVLIFLLFLIFLIFVSEYIITPVSKLRKNMEEISIGSFRNKINSSSDDEVGDLSKIFNKMIDNINETMVSKRSLLKELKERDEYERVINENNLVSKTDIDGNITYVNDEFCKILGYKKEELLEENHRIIKHPDIAASVYEDLWETILSGNVYRGILKNLSKEKEEIYLYSTIFPIFNEKNKIKEFIAIRFDITEEVKLQNELENQYKQLTTITSRLNYAQHLAKIGSYEFNVKTNDVYWSDEHFRMVNEEVNSFIPTYNKYLEYIHPDDRYSVQENLNKTILLGVRTTFKYRFKLKNNEIKYLESSAAISKYDLDGKPLIISGNIIDETEKIKQIKELLQKDRLLVQQSKMATMGEMIGNIAHQWKQPLNLISMSNGLLKINKEDSSFSTEEELAIAYTNIDNAVNHLSNTIDDFRNFFKPDKEKRYFNLRTIFEKTEKLIISQFKNNDINIISEINDIELFAYENELLQVLINLLKNSKDELINTEKGKKRLIFIDMYEEKNNAIIKIRDNAGGIKEENMPKIFEAYFTTKKDDEGTGIGLYMSRQIIEGMNGEILVSNVTFEYEALSCHGAEFKIILPNL